MNCFTGTNDDELLQFRVITKQVIAGDFNNDGFFNGIDLAIWQANSGLNDAADGDRDIDGRNFLIWQRQFNQSVPEVGVPEPSSLFLGLIGLIACLKRTVRSDVGLS